MREIRTSETLEHAVTPAARLCASLIRLDDISNGGLDNTKLWAVIADLFQDMASGINSLADAMQTFEGVVQDYAVPERQTTRRGKIIEIARGWQRANTVLFVSHFFEETQSETMKFLSILLIARGKEAGLSLSGLQRGWGKHWKEYSGVHAEQYKGLSEQLLAECGFTERGDAQRHVSLEQAIEGYLASSLHKKAAA